MAADKKHEPAPEHAPAHGHAHGAHGHASGPRAIEQLQAELIDLQAEIAAALPEIEADSAKARRQLERIAAAQTKWKLTHEPEDPFDPQQFEPPMVPLKADPKKQQAFHALHYKIAKLEAELVAAMKAAVTG